MGKAPGSSPGRWSFKIWSAVFECGVGSLVLLGMLALWCALDALQVEEIAASTALRPSRSSTRTQLGHEICDRSLYPPPWELRSDQLTILVNGFGEARLPLLRSSLRVYSASPAVHSIFVLWGNTSTPDAVLQAAEFESVGAPIFMVRQKSTSLNDRFLPRRHVKTKAVMICDDDVTVDATNLEFALQVWRENQPRIVGFFPRAHSYALDTHEWIYIKHPQKYSIMLTKIMILATDYLYRYSCEIPPGVHEYVDKGTNCEDIAMNFLVSNLSGAGPLLVEGQPRDWGDTRNSAEELTSMGLSARADHRKDRGDCIREFQRLWNGMQLRFSYAKAIRSVDEQVKCEKFGHLIDCDLSASSLRDARRYAGHHLVKRTDRFAYVTLLQSKVMFYAALVWAQAIRDSGSVHDLVLLLDVNSGLQKDNETLTQHFDVVKEVGELGRRRQNSGSNPKLSAWELRDYERVVYMDPNLLCLANLDFLFALPEPAAAPRTSRPQEFHTGLLVLHPSNATFTALLQWTERMSTKADRSIVVDEHKLLNGFFPDWFHMSAAHRLPLRFNMPLHLTSLPAPPSSNGSESTATLPGVLQYNKRDLVSLQHRLEGSNHTLGFRNQTLGFGNQTLGFRIPTLGVGHQEENKDSAGFGIWLEILAALRSNQYQPLDDEQIAHLSWKPSSSTATTSWPPTNLSTQTLNPKPPRRKAFATVLASVDHLAAVGGWITTFSRFHVSGHESLLLVHDSLARQAWKPFEALFDSIVVVEGGSNNSSNVVMLHLWNQTEYEKLVYVDPGSIFLSNCGFLLEMEAFAAAPDFLLPDTFSLQVMVIQPDHRRFSKLSRSYSIATPSSMVGFLNACHRWWYSSSPKHRIEAIFNAEASDFQKALDVDLSSWKIFSFYSTSPFLNPGSETAVIWRKYVCSVHSRTVDLLSSHLDLCNPKP